MTTENIMNTVSFEAAEDLSSDQYRYVVLDSDGKVERPNAATDIPIGILQNAPESGQEARVALLGSGGISKVRLGATISTVGVIAALEFVSATDAGKAQPAASTQYPAGIFIGIGDEDEVGSVILSSVTVKA